MLQYRIEGLDELLKKASPTILREPLKRFFERSAITVQGKARAGAPVDTGHLRNSIQYEVDKGSSSGLPQYAKVGFLNAAEGSPLYFKARAMEFGTGSQGDPSVSHRSTHSPPGPALQVWAERHGFKSGYQVARIIAKRGGLKPRPFLRPALQNSLGEIRGFVRTLGDEIRAAWDKK